MVGMVRRFGPQAVLLLATLTALFPLWIMVTGAFKTQADFTNYPLAPPTSPTLEGMRSALTEEFGRWFLNSVILTGGSVVLVLMLASTAAWGFARWDFRGRDALLSGLVSLMVIPPVVLVVPLFNLGSDLDLVGTYQYVILIYVAFMLPFSVYLLTSFFRTIPKPLIEAAVVDGARSFAVFWRVVLPLSKAPLITLAVVNVIWVWNELLIALVFLNDDAHRTLMVGITGFQSRHSLDIPTIMAGLSVASLPIVALYAFGQRFFIRGLVTGAVKGE
jgi:ABC-type glycerol-3-phosphate transport system permease component